MTTCVRAIQRVRARFCSWILAHVRRSVLDSITDNAMDPEKIKKIWSAVKTIIEVIIGFLCGAQIDSWMGGPLM